MKRLYTGVLIFLYLASYTIAEDSRIFMDSFINGQPVKLVFDTGAEGPILFRQAADRLKLSIKKPPSDVPVEPGKMRLVLTEKCEFRLVEDGTESTLQFAVVDIPSHIKPDFDGFLGWGCIKHFMIEMDSSSHRVKIRDTINFDRSEWKCLGIRTDLNILVVKTASDDTTQDSFLIDTGSPDGLAVRKELWQQLTGKEAEQNTTLSAFYFPSIGLVVNKEKWIQDVNFGNLRFHEIPVKMGLEEHSAITKEGIDGIVGMWALSCYTWIVDGPAGKIYFRENDLKRIPEKYEYNRLGAVFVPEDIQTTDPQLAHVIEGGPAYRAGIRDGDELLRIGAIDITKWRTDPNVLPMSRFWEKPAGTKLDLVLMRNGKKLEITVTLEEIFK